MREAVGSISEGDVCAQTRFSHTGTYVSEFNKVKNTPIPIPLPGSKKRSFFQIQNTQRPTISRRRRKVLDYGGPTTNPPPFK